jgi:hypothetical protein
MTLYQLMALYSVEWDVIEWLQLKYRKVIFRDIFCHNILLSDGREQKHENFFQDSRSTAKTRYFRFFRMLYRKGQSALRDAFTADTFFGIKEAAALEWPLIEFCGNGKNSRNLISDFSV